MTESDVFADAVRYFWASRKGQQAKQVQSGRTDRGQRSAVTGGGQMDGFVRTMSELLIDAGVAPDEIHFGRRKAVLPGYYRATKEWDMLVIPSGRLAAVIELKSMSSSFGNNHNNRVEEALGSAADIWVAYRENAFGAIPQPWLGYLLLLGDTDEAHRPVAVQEPHYGVFEEFRDASYAKRFELLCRRMVLERQYQAACLMLADEERADETPNYAEPAGDLGADSFLTQLVTHVSLFVNR